MNLSERDFPTPGIVVRALVEMKDQEKKEPLAVGFPKVGRDQLASSAGPPSGNVEN